MTFSLNLQQDHYIPPETSSTGDFGDLILSTNPDNGSIVNVVDYTTADNLENAIAENINQVDNFLYFPSEAENILTVTIDGTVYSLGIGELEAGKFKYVNGQVELNLAQPLAENSIVTYQRQASPLPNRTTDICLPVDPFLSRWNATGDFNITRTFQAEPTTSFSFQACLADREQIYQELCNGTPVTIENINWIVDGLTITEQIDTDEILVQVPLVHTLAARGNPSKSSIDIPLLKRRSTGSNTYRRSRQLTEFTAEAGVNYQGQNLSVRSSRNDDRAEVTTVREILTNRAIKNASFLFFNDDGVEIRNWYDTKVHIISRDDIRGEFEYSDGGHGSIIDGIKLNTEYRNLQVNLEFDQDVTDQNAGITRRKIFTNCRDQEDLFSPREDRLTYFTEPSSEIFYNPGINFDAGGRIKEMSDTVYFNGTPTFSTNIKTGYAFDTTEVYDIEITGQGNIILKPKIITPQLFWKQVSTTTTNYLFDGQGYRIIDRITGQELTRMQQESEKLEAVILKAQAIQADELNPDESLLAQSDAYKFTKTLPIDDISNHTLERFSDYYADTNQPVDPCNDDNVESKFVSSMARFSQSQILAPDPRSSEEFVYPLLVTGEQSVEFRNKTITSSVFPFQYEEIISTAKSQGERLKNAIAITSNTQHDGKPPIAPRLNRDLDPTDSSSNNNFSLYRDGNYFISSAGVADKRSFSEGSISYPDVDSPLQVASIARTELSITNSRSSRFGTIDIYWRAGVEEGDFALIDGYLWKIFIINDNREIKENKYESTSFLLTIGRFLESDIVLENRKECNE